MTPASRAGLSCPMRALCGFSMVRFGARRYASTQRQGGGQQARRPPPLQIQVSGDPGDQGTSRAPSLGKRLLRLDCRSRLANKTGNEGPLGASFSTLYGHRGVRIGRPRTEHCEQEVLGVASARAPVPARVRQINCCPTAQRMAQTLSPAAAASGQTGWAADLTFRNS
jgi:hypothetical protein